jgi:multidrug efflux pump subunit AcrB
MTRSSSWRTSNATLRRGRAPREAAHKSDGWTVTGAVIAIAFGLSGRLMLDRLPPAASPGSSTGSSRSIAVATMLSAFNSLTLSPALCALSRSRTAREGLVRAVLGSALGRPFVAFNRTFEAMSTHYTVAPGRLAVAPNRRRSPSTARFSSSPSSASGRSDRLHPGAGQGLLHRRHPAP